jgi:hypothetical protein
MCISTEGLVQVPRHPLPIYSPHLLSLRKAYMFGQGRMFYFFSFLYLIAFLRVTKRYLWENIVCRPLS